GRVELHCVHSKSLPVGKAATGASAVGGVSTAHPTQSTRAIWNARLSSPFSISPCSLFYQSLFCSRLGFFSNSLCGIGMKYIFSWNTHGTPSTGFTSYVYEPLSCLVIYMAPNCFPFNTDTAVFHLLRSQYLFCSKLSSIYLSCLIFSRICSFVSPAGN